MRYMYADLDEAQEHLAELRDEQFPCRDCVAVAINGVNTHETGCPAARRIANLERAIERAEEA